MRSYNKYIFLSILLSMVSCGASMKGDAEEAASLTVESLRYLEAKDLEKSEKAFLEAETIRQKYSEKEAFYEQYIGFLNQEIEKNKE